MILSTLRSRIAAGRFDAWIPWSFFLFFAVVFAANGIMVYAALTSWRGVETEGHYRKGLAYNQVIDESKRMAALGWRHEISFARETGLAGTLTLRLFDAVGEPVGGGAVDATFIRPTQDGHDFTVPMQKRGDGRHVATVTLPMLGLWDVRIGVEHAEGPFRATERLVIR